MPPHGWNEESFHGLLDVVPDAMVVVNRQGRIVRVNTQAEVLFGYDSGELLGRPVETLVPAGRRDTHARHRDQYGHEPLRRLMGSGLELFGCRKDGTQFPVDISLSPLAARDGPLVMAAVRDNTAKAATERALKAANRELEAFTYSVSHDLRAPIRQIDGFSKLLEEHCGEVLDEQGRHYLRRISAGAQGMERLVDDLLALSRIGQQEFHPRRVSLDDLVRDVVRDLESEVGARTVEWRVRPLPMSIGDASLLRIALTNLLSNALKYTRPRDRAVIEVGPHESNGSETIMVRDNGVGFDPKYADKLFGVFQRLHRPEEFEGQGVGLALVQRIIHRHDGEIWADARPGEGATFFFTLPRADGPEGRAA